VNNEHSGVAREDKWGHAPWGEDLGGAPAHFCKHLKTRFKQKFRQKVCLKRRIKRRIFWKKTEKIA